MLDQGVVQGLQWRAGFGRPVGQSPTQGQRSGQAGAPLALVAAGGVDQRQQHVQAGRVGKMQIVDQQPGQLALRHEQGLHRALQHQALALAAGARHGAVELRQHARDLAARAVLQRRCGGRQSGHGAQQPRQ